MRTNYSKLLSVNLISVFFLLSCSESNTKYTNLEIKNIKRDSLKNELFFFNKDDVNVAIFDEMTSVKLSRKRKIVVEKIIELAKKNHLKENANDSLLIRNEYYYQIVAGLEENRDTIVWVNASCKEYIEGDQDQDIIFINKGSGICHFNLLINLSQNKYWNFSIDGGWNNK